MEYDDAIHPARWFDIDDQQPVSYETADVALLLNWYFDTATEDEVDSPHIAAA